jgi:hypothetical protein
MDQFLDFFINTQTTLSVVDVLINITLSGLFSFLVRFVFIQYAHTASNRMAFANIFFLLSVCTTLIIALIQSSIALSLGLVGALSIVRFRAAIKEPEELVYLFFCIAIGLGFGANEKLLTMASAIAILSYLMIRGKVSKKNTAAGEIYNFDITSGKLGVEDVVKAVKPYSSFVTLKRHSSDERSSNTCLSIELNSIENLDASVKHLKELDPAIKVSYISSNVLG